MERIKELADVEEILGGRLNTDNGQVLSSQLVEIEAWAARVAYLLYSAKQELDVNKSKALMPKSKEYTDLDRVATQEAMVSAFQAKADYLAALQDTIKRRISLGQTLLKNMQVEMQSGVSRV